MSSCAISLVCRLNVCFLDFIIFLFVVILLLLLGAVISISLLFLMYFLVLECLHLSSPQYWRTLLFPFLFI